MLEILLPQSCMGCGRAGTRLCKACFHSLRTPPQRITTRVDPHMPTWSLGPYGGPRRSMIIGIKERNRRDAQAPLAAMTKAAIDTLIARGELDEDIVIVPAPTSKASARRRGGDPVARVAYDTGFDVAPLLEHSASVRDQVGLDVQARRANLARGVKMVDNWARIAARVGLIDADASRRGREHVRADVQSYARWRGQRAVVILDDVFTTGATMASSAAVLTSAGIKIRGGLGWSNA